jgi:hypothetical protein
MKIQEERKPHMGHISIKNSTKISELANKLESLASAYQRCYRCNAQSLIPKAAPVDADSRKVVS